MNPDNYTDKEIYNILSAAYRLKVTFNIKCFNVVRLCQISPENFNLFDVYTNNRYWDFISNRDLFTKLHKAGVVYDLKIEAFKNASNYEAKRNEFFQKTAENNLNKIKQIKQIKQNEQPFCPHLWKTANVDAVHKKNQTRDANGRFKARSTIATFQYLSNTDKKNGNTSPRVRRIEIKEVSPTHYKGIDLEKNAWRQFYRGSIYGDVKITKEYL